MRTIYAAALASAIALSAFVSVTSSAAKAGPIVPPGHYCLAYDHGGSDCSFTNCMRDVKQPHRASMPSVTAKPFRTTRVHETKAVLATIREPRSANAQPLMI